MSAGCPQPLIGLDYPCGRAIDEGGLGLCAHHTAEVLGTKLSSRPTQCPCGATKILAKGLCCACYNKATRAAQAARAEERLAYAVAKAARRNFLQRRHESCRDAGSSIHPLRPTIARGPMRADHSAELVH